jgi:hypothetical protein
MKQLLTSKIQFHYDSFPQSVLTLADMIDRRDARPLCPSSCHSLDLGPGLGPLVAYLDLPKRLAASVSGNRKLGKAHESLFCQLSVCLSVSLSEDLCLRIKLRTLLYRYLYASGQTTK